MPQSQGLGSVLSNVAAQRRRVVQTRKMLGLGERGIETPQRPLPPQQPPADTRPPQTAPTSNVPPERMTQLYANTAAMLERIRSGGRESAAPTEQALFTPTSTGQRPAAEALNEVLAETARPEIQFFRLAGRPASPRELSIFNSRIELERQLGRVPTMQELKGYISTPPGTQSRAAAMEMGEG